MGRLPSGYDAINFLGTTQSDYIDTGVIPSSALEIEGKFHFGYQSDTNVYIFGARNTSSNSSSGQTTYEYISGTGCYVGYNGTRTRVGGGKYVHIKKGEAVTYSGISGAITDIPSDDFTNATKTMYILARNNGGTAQSGSTIHGRGVYGLKIWENGTLIRDYIPCYKNTAPTSYGLYEAVSGTYTSISSPEVPVWLTVNSTTGGKGYVKTDTAGKVTKFGVQYTSTQAMQPYIDNVVNLCAEPADGYVFRYWMVGNDIISTEPDAQIKITNGTTVTAVFEKKVTDEQNNGFKALGLQYGVGLNGLSAYQGLQSNIFGKIRSAVIKEDSMAKSTSTIELEETPLIYQNDMPLFIRDSMGKTIYGGVIKNISKNTITCREPLSIVDGEAVLNWWTGYANTTVHSYVSRIANLYLAGYPVLKSHSNDGSTPLFDPNSALRRKGLPYVLTYDSYVYFGLDKNYVSAVPVLEDTSVGNIEDYILDLSNQYVIYFKPELITESTSKKSRMKLTSINPYAYDRLIFGDNSEEISNVTIEVEDAEATVLQVFNETATTLRGTYGVKNDGTLADLPVNLNDLTDFLAYNECKLKVLCSSERLNVLKEQYLSNAFFNHKITFDVNLSKGTFKFDDFRMGRRVNFYNGNKVYNSIITAREYQIESNSDDIKSAKITLGKVRTNLTSKLNLGKVKGKK